MKRGYYSASCALIALLLAHSGTCNVAWAHEDPPLNPARLSQQDLVALVKQLGSPSFAQREKAQKKLKYLGLAALPAVTAGCADKDPEISRRCKELIPELHDIEKAKRRQEQEARIRAFVSGSTDPYPAAWKRFKVIVGESPQSRRLFGEIIADDRRAAVIEKAEANPDKAHELYVSESRIFSETNSQALKQAMEEMQASRQTIEQRRQIVRPLLLEALPAAQVALVMFLATFGAPQAEPDSFNWRPGSAGFDEGVNGPLKEPYRKLFVAWLDSRRHARHVWGGFIVAMSFGLGEAAPTARRVLADKNSEQWPVFWAMIVLGNHGNKDDLPPLLALRNDTRVQYLGQRSPFHPAETVPHASSRVCDVAAAMALQIAGQDWATFGFPSAGSGGDQLASANPVQFRRVMWFESEAARSAVAKKAWEWLDQNAKPPERGSKP